MDALKLTPEERNSGRACLCDAAGLSALTALAPGREFEVPEVLFRKVEQEDVRRLTAQFGGTPA